MYDEAMKGGPTVLKTIRLLREEQGLSQFDLANKVGVTPSTVYNWERGKYEPRYSQMRALAFAFGVPMDDIVPTEAELAKEKTAA